MNRDPELEETEPPRLELSTATRYQVESTSPYGAHARLKIPVATADQNSQAGVLCKPVPIAIVTYPF